MTQKTRIYEIVSANDRDNLGYVLKYKLPNNIETVIYSSDLINNLGSMIEKYGKQLKGLKFKITLLSDDDIQLDLPTILNMEDMSLPIMQIEGV